MEDNLKDYNRNTHTRTLKGLLSKTNPDDWKSYHEMYLGGTTFRQLGELLGICHKSIKKQFENLGFKTYSKDYIYTLLGYLNKKDCDEWSELYNLYVEGNSLRDLESKLGVDKTHIKNIFTSLGYLIKSESEVLRDMSDKLKDINYSSKLDTLKDNGYELLDDYEGVLTIDGKWKTYNFRHKVCGFKFKDDYNGGFTIRCPKCFPLFRSFREINYCDFIEGKGLVCQSNTRRLIKNFEIDIYIPELNTGFEYNGDYWHSSARDKDKNYHANKSNLCLEKGIKLYHIWEHDDIDIVKSMILGKLGKITNKYFARKLTTKEVDVKERRDFFNSNHLHGDVRAKFALGLYDNDELVSCVSFRSHKEGIEIARFATKLNSSVVGGFSKLLKYSKIKCRELGFNKIVTYCDRDWTPSHEDSVYFKNGFKFIKDTGVQLRYYNGDAREVESRETYQKHKLKELFPKTYKDSLTADEILKLNNIYAIYNSGNWKYELDI